MAEAIRAAEEAAGPAGRVLVRYSGTEPRLRILVEAPTAAVAERACAVVASAAARALG